MILFCVLTEEFFRALHRYTSYDGPEPHFHHANHLSLTGHIFFRSRWQYFDPMMFYRYPGDQRNKVLGFSYRLSISILPGIREFALLSYPFRNDPHLIFFLPFSGRNDLPYKPPREGQASGRDDCKQRSNPEWWDASFPISQCLS